MREHEEAHSRKLLRQVLVQTMMQQVAQNAQQGPSALQQAGVPGGALDPENLQAGMQQLINPEAAVPMPEGMAGGPNGKPAGAAEMVGGAQ